MSIISNALLFFLVTNPIGNAPTILAIVKDYPFERQKKILFREGVFALLIALFAQFFGDFFLNILQAKNYALTLTGGCLLLILSIHMIFPKKEEGKQAVKQEPFIVPIATPLLTGAGIISIIMIKAKIAVNFFDITAAILIAFAGVIGILMIAPYIQRLIGKRGLDALEQIMGMILALIATEMLVKGTQMFVDSIKV